MKNFVVDLDIIKDEIIDNLAKNEDYPFCCVYSSELVYKLLHNSYKNLKIVEGYYDNKLHYWNSIVFENINIIIDFTRVQFDNTKVSNIDCWRLSDIKYLDDLKNNHSLQYEYLIYPNCRDYKLYEKRKWNYNN